ncbi:MAG: flagellar motor switch phosphatase FliY [Clostridiaceae bacterium]|nr:flagellar motor switch phosphatase FliY [Clostridiaceae bacterium]MBW4858746.1 flagellar motor switch phosphatase FliY [Clostridiaceae bacterium]MBW4868205.1 flagellar motor switch phosphatase FliY [Clostridiaceae bacterium]
MNNDMLSQEEIDALLKGTDKEEEISEEIGDIEKDALGEIGNISMGTAATTLSTLLNQKVTITTPKVTITTIDKLADAYQIPFVAIDVTYKEGLEGANILILKVDDVKVITDIMMGKDEIDLERELTELDLSAVSEVMNQMMGSASTSLSEMFFKKIDIEPPKSYEITFNEGKEKIDVLKGDQPLVKISFRMVVGDIIDSEMMQLVPIDFAKEVVDILLGSKEEASATEEAYEIDNDFEVNKEIPKAILFNEKKENTTEKVIDSDEKSEEAVVVKKPVFETFNGKSNTSYNESIDLVAEIPVEITAELGRTTKKIDEILEYGPGTIIELDKLVGEPLNIYANGKSIARGEVVVIDDNFGIRITEIVNSYKNS